MTTRGSGPLFVALSLALTVWMPHALSASMKGPQDMARPALKAHLHSHDKVPGDSPSAAATTLYGYVSLYQQIFSTLKWSNCQFSPSCSHYTKQALEQYGGIAGIGMAGDRLIRCNRWAWDSGEYKLLDSGHLHDPLSDQLPWSRR